MSDPAIDRLILQVADSVGALMERWGFKRNMGRLWGLLYLEQRAATHSGQPPSSQACVADWRDHHRGLHGYAAIRTELDRRFGERFFAWTPYLYAELGDAIEPEERTLIEAGSIQATGFNYVVERPER